MICSRCGKEISTAGTICPYCKHNKRQDVDAWMLGHIFGLIGAAIGFTIFLLLVKYVDLFTFHWYSIRSWFWSSMAFVVPVSVGWGIANEIGEQTSRHFARRKGKR